MKSTDDYSGDENALNSSPLQEDTQLRTVWANGHHRAITNGQETAEQCPPPWENHDLGSLLSLRD